MARVLIADDEPIVLRAIKRLLRDHEVVTVDDGTAVARLLESGAVFDVLVCDLNMPGMSGPELFALMTARYPDQARRTIFATGGAAAPAAAALLSAIDNETIDKPFESRTLLEAIDRVLAIGPSA